MTRRLTVSPAAERDLADIGDYIALDNPSRAVSFLDGLAAKARQVAERPCSFPERADIVRGIRVARHRRYLIFFTVGHDEVRVERVLHGSRDLHALLGNDT